ALHHQGFLSLPGPGQDIAIGIRNETVAPELNPARGIALVADPVDRRDEHAVGDRVAALHGFPGVLLGGAVLRLLRWQPADRRGEEKDVGAVHRGEPGAFGIPLVPADQGADLAEPGLPALEAEIARGEIEFLVVL